MRPGEELLTVEVIERGTGVVCVELHGECDLSEAGRLSEVIRSAAYGADEVRIDLSGLEFMDSSALNVLYRASVALALVSKRFVLVAPPAGIRRVLDITQLGSHFEIADEQVEGPPAFLNGSNIAREPTEIYEIG